MILICNFCEAFIPLVSSGTISSCCDFPPHDAFFLSSASWLTVPQMRAWEGLGLPSSRLWKPSIRLGFVLGFIFILYTNTPFGGQECDTCRVPSECHPLAMQLRHLLMSGVVFCVPTTQYMQPCQAFEHERCDWCWRPSKNVQSFSNGLINPKMKSRVPAVIPLIIHWRS